MTRAQFEPSVALDLNHHLDHSQTLNHVKKTLSYLLVFLRDVVDPLDELPNALWFDQVVDDGKVTLIAAVEQLTLAHRKDSILLLTHQALGTDSLVQAS